VSESSGNLAMIICADLHPALVSATKATSSEYQSTSHMNPFFTAIKREETRAYAFNLSFMLSIHPIC